MNNIFPRPLGVITMLHYALRLLKNQKSSKERLSKVIVIIALLITFLPKEGVSQCIGGFSCNSIQTTVDQNDCTFNIFPSLVVNNFSNLPSSCSDLLKVRVTDLNDVLIAEGPTLLLNLGNINVINDSLIIIVFQDDNGNDMYDGQIENSCWSFARIEDKQAPDIGNCDDVTVYCYEELANVTGGPIFPITATDNCSNSNNVSITLADSTLTKNTCSQNANVKATLVKKWIVEDERGNKDSCTQTITILRLPTIGVTIEAPVNAMLECNSSNQPDTSAAALGYPMYTFDNNGNTVTIELNPTNLSGLCEDMKVFYSDSPALSGCGDTEKYIRTFQVFDCCANVFLDTVVQTIEFVDTQAPTLTCPSDLSFGTTSTSCGANVFLPPVGISDACSNSNFTVSVTTPNGTINTNGGIVSNVPIGVYNITYTVEDDCGNEATCSIPLIVFDDDTPIAVCDETTVVSLNNQGQGLINAISFDDGSSDNCGIVSYQVRRMASNCSAQTSFSDLAFFSCCDIGEVIMVELQVTDAAGNTNSCMVEVEVQDKENPLIICPSDKIIECGQDTSATVLGMAIGNDNCGSTTVSWQNAGTLDPTCGTGVLQRIWTVTDGQGAISNCIQTITVVNTDPFSGNTDPNDSDNIIFPGDIMGNNSISCAALQNDPTLIDPANTGEPIIVGNNQSCSMVGIAIPSDLEFELGTGDCAGRKIFRKWAVVDWCQASDNPDLTQDGPGVWVHSQLIMIVDDVAPVLSNAPQDITLSVDANCEAMLTLPSIPSSDIQDCNPNVAISVTTNMGGNGFGPFTVTVGNYQATYLLDDGCGNTTTHIISVTVEDDKQPTPVCEGISAPLMMTMPSTGMLTFPAMTFVNGSTNDNCTDFSDLDFTVTFAATNDPNTPAVEEEITFTCFNVGPIDIALWVCDEAGNCDFCIIEVMITSNGACGQDLAPTVAGIIDNEFGKGIEEVEVYINDGMYMEMTDINGQFSMENLPADEDYNIKPTKYDNPRNGVSTFDIVQIRKHILGIELLDSPYKLIAGDVNGSGNLSALDIVQIRNLILWNVDEFPNGMPSWRFVDANFVFSNPNNPFEDNFSEEKNIQDLATDLDDLDFVAIKLGDVTGNASPNVSMTETRDAKKELAFITKDQFVKEGELVNVILETEELQNINAWQFSFLYEKSKLEFLDLEKMENVHYGTSVLEEGAITFTWTRNENTLLEGKPKWIELQFLAKENINLRDVLNISSRYTTAVAYDDLEVEYKVQLQFTNSTNNEAGAFQLFENIPNPFTETTLINFYLPKEDNVEILIYDNTGRLLKTYNVLAGKGNQNFTVKAKDIGSSGLLYYRLRTSEFEESGKMILLP